MSQTCTFLVKANTLDDVKQVQTRILIAIQKEEDPDLIKYLLKKTKTKELEEYKKSITDFNENLKTALEHSWQYNKNIEYKTIEEFNLLKKDKENIKKYACIYLQCYAAQTKVEYKNGILQDTYAGTYKGRDGYALEIALAETNRFGGAVLSKVSSSNPSLLDLIQLVQGLCSICDFIQKSHDENLSRKEYDKSIAQILKNRTLLVDANDLNEKFGEKEIKKIYPFSVEITTDNKIVEVILKKDTTYAYLRKYPETTYLGVYTADKGVCGNGIDSKDTFKNLRKALAK